MADHAAFHAAILAAPDDDLPRLMYADWLDEQGDPRGQFIRMQIAAHTGDFEAAESAQALEKEHGRAWAGRLASWVYKIGFSRGFPDSIVIRGDDFLGHVAAIFRLAPIRQVTLIRAREPLRHILRMPHLANLNALHLTGCGLADREAQKLADCQHLTSLRTLRLSNNEIGCSGAAALAASEQLQGLHTLDLANNDVGDWGARALAGSRTLTRLEQLDLSGNTIGSGGEGSLRRSPAFAATRLNLDGQRQLGGWAKNVKAVTA
ncbi:MAG: TIGR02996 domain-containing protein [Gemmataceae bacterium]